LRAMREISDLSSVARLGMGILGYENSFHITSNARGPERDFFPYAE